MLLICGIFFLVFGVKFTVKVRKLDCLGAEFFFFGCLGVSVLNIWVLSAEYFFFVFQ